MHCWLFFALFVVLLAALSCARHVRKIERRRKILARLL